MGDRLLTLLLVSLLAAAALCACAQAADTPAAPPLPLDDGEKRIALVIGNAAYESGPLRNPVNDAKAMTATLRQLGFEVFALENAGQGAIKQAIDDFGESLHKAGKNTVGLLYYSGHGVQVKGRNYIIPVGAKIKTERQVEYESVDVGRALGAMEDAGNVLNIVILDACRDNPFARSARNAANGLAMMDAASGTLIAYATAPGRTADDGSGDNGLYTQQLIRYMRVPGLKVEEVFKRVRSDVERLSDKAQVPWESSSLKGDFYFAGKRAALGATGPALDDEEVLWSAIERSVNPQDFDDYLARYPQGRFALAARSKARQARDKVSPELSPVLSGLSLATTPPGATVYLDGGFAGKTPVDITRIQPRRYVVEMLLDGYRPWREEVLLRGGQLLSFNELLQPYALAMLDARNVDDTARIYLNGEYRGKGGTIIEDIEPGEYAVQASRPRSPPWKTEVQLRAGAIETLQPVASAPYQVAVFPGRLTGQYLNSVDRTAGRRTGMEWGLFGVHEALMREPGLKLVFAHYDGFPVAKQVLPEIQKQTWKGLLSNEVNTAFLRAKGQEMGLDAIVLLVLNVPASSGPVEVYVYDPQHDQLHRARGTWRSGNMAGNVADLTRTALDQFFNARAARP